MAKVIDGISQKKHWHKGESLKHGFRCIAADVCWVFCGCEAGRLLLRKYERSC